MRYYEVHVPGYSDPAIVTNVRKLRDLPEGTRIEAIITDRDGSLVETYDVPVVDGRAQISGKGKQNPRMVR